MPRVSVSRPQIGRAVKAVHVILTNVEVRGILFRKYRGSLEPGYFESSGDHLYVEISEAFVPRQMTPHEIRRGMWQYPENPTGRLVVKVQRRGYRADEQKCFEESARMPIDQVLAEAVRNICLEFAAIEKERAEEKERMRKEHEAWLVRQHVERQKQHEDALERTKHSRSADLLKASEWHRLHIHTLEFIGACERRWREGQAGEITADQQAWLEWAKGEALALSPFEVGYPDAAEDGAFDKASIPVGGPYPATRDFPHPPTMPKIPTPVQQSGYSHVRETKEPYPFWLRHSHGS